MKVMGNFMRLSILLVAALFSLMACAEETSAPEQYKAGVHYQILPIPLPTRAKDKIEVTEFFWYGCGHCFKFEPLLERWAKTLPDDVVFTPTPAIFSKEREGHARAFYTAQVLGILDKIHQPIFNAMNLQKKYLASEGEMASFFADYGVDKETFSKTFNSFGVSSLVRQADARTRGAMITGTPEMMVNGKYRISSSDAGSQEEMLKVVDFLIAKERAAMAQ